MSTNIVNKAARIVVAIGFSALLSACVPVIIGGAAATGAVAADRRTSGIYVEDQNIEFKAAKKMLTNLGENAHVNVTSYNRNVLLTGEVPDQAAKVKAESLLKEVENIRVVTNDLVIGPKTTIGSRSNDTFITSKIKSKFVTENQFPANYVKIVTENSVVYLIGLVNRTEADAAT